MPKNIEEDTSRTVAEPTVVASASRDEAVPTLQAGVPLEPAAEKAADLAEVVETVELEQPAAEPIEYEDSVANADDPRQIIAKKHQDTQRHFEEDPEITAAGDETAVESTDTPDIISADDLKESMVEIKIYDETRMVAKSKVDKAGGVVEYQKQVAVAEGFQRNAQKAKELEDREARIAEREANQTAPPDELPTLDAQHVQTPNPDDPPASGDQSLEKLLSDYHEALLDGDDESRNQLALKLHKRNSESQQPLDMDSMIDRVAEKAADKLAKREADERARQRLIDTTTAASALIERTPQLQHKNKSYDRILFTAVNDETDIIQKQHPDWEPAKVIAEAWNKVKSWKGGTNVSSMSAKQELKRGMNRPQASTGRYTPPPAPPERTDSDYVTDLKKSRGQT